MEETGTKPARIKKRRLKYIAVLPSFITLMNGACGFIAIVFACRSAEVRWNVLFVRNLNMSSLALAGYMVFLAMLADVLDGRVARLTRTTSSFGGQLDSLSDAISFGVAPAFLMVKLLERNMDHLQFDHFRFSLLVWRCIFFSAVFYAMCAIVRLARFNVENEENEAAHMNFAGLPSPAAAGVIVSLVIIHQQILPRILARAPDTVRTLDIISISVLPLVTFFSGLLMVSRIRYPHLANQLLRGKKSLTVLLLLFACGLFIVWNLQLAMVVGFCGFALFGVFRWLIFGIFKKPRRPPSEVKT
jgi:CDP-diacylglycerol---serine O-phosphatidyltransferase